MRCARVGYACHSLRLAFNRRWLVLQNLDQPALERRHLLEVLKTPIDLPRGAHYIHSQARRMDIQRMMAQ
jgi:hypothetical protein